MSTVKVIVRKTKGGPGSGNWGHSGRPGAVGGSTPGKGGGGSTASIKLSNGEAKVGDKVEPVNRMPGLKAEYTITKINKPKLSIQVDNESWFDSTELRLKVETSHRAGPGWYAT